MNSPPKNGHISSHCLRKSIVWGHPSCFIKSMWEQYFDGWLCRHILTLCNKLECAIASNADIQRNVCVYVWSYGWDLRRAAGCAQRWDFYTKSRAKLSLMCPLRGSKLSSQHYKVIQLLSGPVSGLQVQDSITCETMVLWHILLRAVWVSEKNKIK